MRQPHPQCPLCKAPWPRCVCAASKRIPADLGYMPQPYIPLRLRSMGWLERHLRKLAGSGKGDNGKPQAWAQHLLAVAERLWWH